MRPRELLTSALDRSLQDALLEEGAELDGGGRLIVAFSGGLDSTVLLHVASAYRPGGVVAWHVNHHLVPQSDSWARHCRAVSEGLGVALDELDVRVDARANVEQRARTARYAAWRARLAPGDRLLLAHHLDDQVETLLLRAVRGGASALLRGMPRARRLGAGVLLRPFLGLERRVLAMHGDEAGLSWVTDPANSDLRFDRSFVRARVLPALRERFPGAVEGLARSAALLDEDAAIVDAWLDAELRAMTDSSGAIELDALLAHRYAARLLRRWLAGRGIESVPRTRIESILEQARTAAPDRTPRVGVGHDRFVARHRGRLHLVQAPSAFPPQRWQLGAPLRLPHGTLTAVNAPRGELPLEVTCVEVRSRHPHDVLVPSGRSVPHRLKTMFQEAGVPPWERAAYPLVCIEDELALVPGIAVAERFAARGPGWRIEWQPDLR